MERTVLIAYALLDACRDRKGVKGVMLSEFGIHDPLEWKFFCVSSDDCVSVYGLTSFVTGKTYAGVFLSFEGMVSHGDR